MLILTTKLHMPASLAELVPRARLTERLNEGMNGKLTLVSAPAGFGKTTLVSEWAAGSRQPVAWISMDEEDNDPIQFLTYIIAALQMIKANIAEGVLSVLQYAQSPPSDSMLTTLLNEISTIPEKFTLVLDDYHVANSKAADHILKFLLEHLPPQMHLIITTREDLHIPLNRLRVQNQLTELRAADLRFTSSEAAEFLNRVMSLHLSTEDITALENRTEGWIAGLQLAAISMKGHHDTASFIKSFSGSHRFVLDYLMEEVFEQQPKNIQTFLLYTSILDRICGSLCDAVLLTPSDCGQEMLEQLEHANMFIVSLDNERRWYRYHHLFADLLRQRLHQSNTSSIEDETVSADELHKRASEWFESNGLEIESFHHAASANDVGRAARLIEGGGIPLYFRGAVAPVLNWIKSLPVEALNAKPLLWATYASLTLSSGQITSVEEKLQAAETTIQITVQDEGRKDLRGRIYAIRATMALVSRQVETVINQSNLALEYLSPDNLAFRTFTIWKLGYACFCRISPGKFQAG
jgi:LuxR family transcriptional regulator, maltose regulon positive regulatory protein